MEPFRSDGPAVKGVLSLKICNVSTYLMKVGQRINSPRKLVASLGWHIQADTEVVNNVTYMKCFLVGANTFRWSASVDATFNIVKKTRRRNGSDSEHSFTDKLMGREPLHCDWGFPKFVTKEVNAPQQRAG